MTDTAAPPTTATHPLDRLSEQETLAAVAIVKADDRFGDRTRFARVDLREPPKVEVLGFSDGDPVDRAAEVILLDNQIGAAVEVVVSLTREEIDQWTVIEGAQPSVILDEFFEAEEAIQNDPDFQAAMAKRGITDMSLVCIDPWSAGNYGDEAETSNRIIRALVWVHEQPGDNQYARPIDGLIVILDLATMEIIRIEDQRVLPVPSAGTTHEWSSSLMDQPRNSIKPLDIVQPEGPSFTLEGDRLTWQKWSVRIGWSHREGLILNQISYDDAGETRPIIYRASLAEMTVPYGDPSDTQARKNAFDVGEYGVGMLANPLELGCDCLGEIQYLDAHVATASGEIYQIPQAICIHEEDFGISWKHTDFRTEEVEVRRLRRLVISFIATVGNYEYAMYWYLYQDGRIEYEVKLTGILSTGGLDHGEDTRYGTKLSDLVYAPNHQHFFCVRLDTEIDGTANTVVEVNTRPAPPEENPWGNAFYGERTVLATEQQAQRRIDPFAGRYWRIESAAQTNRMGTPTGFKLIPGENILPFATEDSSIRKRAGYMWQHLWVTPYDADERYPAGNYPNQSAGGEGLEAWTAADRSVESTDVVVWYVMGHNHLPSLEDWPVMPVASIGFTLRPSGFFDRSAAMDLPAGSGSTTCH
ncbi:primary-amine oxidase [Euzebya tangerina]|uniref:primary-amine oxidase n=1 Tax=Euzebya tangerina TaxID=591198 RepID=UPI000E31EE9E|nr:primary-amine oxidase [Euzebya tangerina]